MKTVLHPAAGRGHAVYDWLDTYHTFSFAGYYDPERVNFGLLRVLNDDLIRGGTGFDTHTHDNMEIVTIPLTGGLRHKDSTGSEGETKSGEIQAMSAGIGVTHSEMNASGTEDCNFLQIWILPQEKDILPRYQQKSFDAAKRQNRFQEVVSPKHENPDTLWINQQAYFSLADLEIDTEISYHLHIPTHGVYLFVIEGSLRIGDKALTRGDGMGIWDISDITIRALEKTNLLLMEVPME